MTIPALERPLPSFKKWLEDRGHSGRAPDFDSFVALAKQAQDLTCNPFDEDEKSFLRLWQGISVAVVELCNMEVEHGRQPHEIALMLPRALATAAMYAQASVLNEETPWRSIAKVLTEEFRYAAKLSADQLSRAAEGRANEKV